MRGKQAKKRKLDPDAKYGSVTVSKLINYILKDGKKSVATRLVYSSLESSSEKLQKDPLVVLDMVIKNVGPLVEVRSHRVGGATYQVPIEVSKNRRLALALRWLIQATNDKKGADFATKLSNEMIAAYNNEGNAIKKKIDTHKMADANKAFAHFAKY
ncbi:MAG: 30S ribosomal protein S7 [Berkelbacteria bacterium GW2011_GWA2_38_9]|uniref:Small ribosomal subunit protein uS7 n=1 Tax=Berkelbacteria bacterium GW2011_GWA2_38_9 TaxID=1618334 RepID=A0A0G0LMM8_9BACT|nr:MAG: 30S ribosomal protein S7 [Berkelbacteria bacterium GW2011_GWA2_38_9]